MRLKFFFAGVLCGLATYVNAQVSELSDLQFFVGSGNDTAGLVIDFMDGEGSKAWGVLFNDSIDGLGMLQAVAAADPVFSIDVTSGFLNDIIYGNQQGIGGQPDYWGTWSGTPFFWTSNLGIGTSVAAGTWFGCSYMDFNPAIEPSTPVNAVSGPITLREKALLRLEAYPVPFNAELNLSSERPASIHIYDAFGSLLSTMASGTDHRIPTSSWPSGVYLIVAQSESDNRAVRRVIK